MQSNYKEFLRKHAALLLLGILLFVILVHRGPLAGGDDALYAEAMRTHSLFEYLSERYKVWSGRLVIDIATLSLVDYPWVWRIGTFVCLMGAVKWIAHVTESDNQPEAIAFLCLALFLVHRAVMTQGAWWVTGGFNYLWPFATGLLTLVPFIHPRVRPAWLAVCIPAAAYGASHEQSGALLLAFEALAGYHLMRQRQLRIGHVLLAAVTLGSFLTVVLAPGSRNRYMVVTQYSFPEYMEWTWDEKMFSGVDFALTHLFRSGNALAAVFTALVAVLVFQRTSSRWLRAVALVPVAVQLLARAKSLLSHFDADSVFVRIWSYPHITRGNGFAVRGISDFASSLQSALYIHFFLVTCSALCLAFSLFNGVKGGRYLSRNLAVLVFLAAIGSGAVMGLTPSIYASEDRVLFFQDMLMLLLTVRVFVELQGKVLKRSVAVLSAILALSGIWFAFASDY
jgi:uncharacterized protein DUF6056